MARGQRCSRDVAGIGASAVASGRSRCLATRNHRVGVIGTQATIATQAYDDAFAAAPGIQLTSMACPRFVEFVERGVTNSPELKSIAESYLEPLIMAGVDTLVLGCTHYPLLTGLISGIMGNEVTLVSSAEETAKDVFRTLTAKGLSRDDERGEPQHQFRSTGDPELFARLARRFLGPEAIQVSRITACA